MYFQTPPDGAAQALLEYGYDSQRATPGKVRTKARDRTGRPVSAVPTGQNGAVDGENEALATKPKRTPKKPQEEPDELTMINNRVEQVIQMYDADPPGAKDGSFKTLSKMEYSELKNNIHGLFGKQAMQSESCTFALRNAVSAIDGSLTNEIDAKELSLAEAEGQDAAKLLGAAEKNDGKMDDLVGNAATFQKAKAHRLDEVHQEEVQMLRQLATKCKELEKTLLQKEDELLDGQNDLRRRTEELELLQSLHAALKEDLAIAKAKAEQDRADLKKERDKPLPPPPAISDAELERLKDQLHQLKRKLTEKEEELIWKAEELRQVMQNAKDLEAKVKMAELRCKTMEEEHALENAKLQTELGRLTAGNAELTKKMQASEAALANSKSEMAAAKRAAEKAAEEAAARVAEAWESVNDQAAAGESSKEAELAKQKADFEKQLREWKRRAEKAEAEAGSLREQIESSGTAANAAALEDLRAQYEAEMAALRAEAALGADSRRRKSEENANERTEELEAQIASLNAEVSKLKAKLKSAMSELETTRTENQSLKEIAASTASTEAQDAAAKVQAAARGRNARKPVEKSLTGFKTTHGEKVCCRWEAATSSHLISPLTSLSPQCVCVCVYRADRGSSAPRPGGCQGSLGA